MAVVPLLLLGAVLAQDITAAEAPRRWPPNQFTPVTLPRILELPRNQQPAWKAYWNASQALRHSLPAPSAPDFSPTQPIAGPPKGGLHTKGLRLDARPTWYSSEEARTIADRVVAHQTAAGAWTKGNDYTEPHPIPSPAEHEVWGGGTYDNDATIFELRYLALVNARADDTPRSSEWRKAFLRGLHYVFESQYPNGGFPQIYPLAGSYHDAVTFNDNAMTHVLEFLRDVSAAKPEFAFVPARLREEAGQRLKRGIDCVLKTQLKGADGRPTIWCQQYDALTLRACAARNFEPVAACAFESSELVTFLMDLPQPSPEVRRAVDDAVAWFRLTPVHGIEWSRFANDAQVVVSPGAPPLWARFYELNTDKPIFGDRDRTIHYAVGELSSERRAGYTWYGDWPAAVLKAYDAWSKKP